MFIKERARAVANAIEFTYHKEEFVLHDGNGGFVYVNCIEEMKRLARQVVVLADALEKITRTVGPSNSYSVAVNDIAHQALKQAEEV